jgi:histidinol-phosphate aminotransferase
LFSQSSIIIYQLSIRYLHISPQWYNLTLIMGYFRDNIERMSGYVPGFQPKTADVVKLNTNENPYPPSPAVLAAIRDITAEQLRRYPDPAGTEFRHAAGKLNGVSADYILCTNGGDELLSLAIRAFCDSKRPLAYPAPTYSLYPVLAELENCKALEIPFDTEYNLPSSLAKTGAALTIVCNPNAPSGSLISVDELASLADELKGKSVLLIDEAYVDFAPVNCAGLVKKFDNVIILRSLSKGYSLAGLRFGYAIAQPSLIDGLMKVKDSYNVNAIAIAAATAAINDQDYFKANVEKVKTERKRVTGELRKLGLTVPESFSNFVLAQCRNQNAEEVFNKLVRQNIYVRYFQPPGIDDKLRITIGTPEQNDKLLEVLKEIL